MNHQSNARITIALEHSIGCRDGWHIGGFPIVALTKGDTGDTK